MLFFMQAVLKAYPDVQAINIGTPDGSFILFTKILTATRDPYSSSLSKPIPADAIYVIREIDRSKEPPQENWYYTDENFEILEQEKASKVTFDPRTRPWYLGVEKSYTLYWSDIYHYNPTGELGITVAGPILSKKGDLQAVVGIDLPVKTLSNFLTEQRIGKRGKAYFLNTAGQILLPVGGDHQTSTIKKAYHLYSKDKGEDFVFEDAGSEYLGHIQPFPVTFERNWLIAIVAPLDDFFEDILQAQKEIVLITILILLIAAILVVYFSKRISKPIVQLSQEIDKIKHLDLGSETRVQSHIREINLLDTSIASMRVMLQSFGRYVPKEIVKQLMQKGQEITLGGEKREVTVFFSDIADFTTTAESLPLEVVMPLLAAYFDKLSKIVLEARGTIDKYIGDSIMAFWGAPSEIPDPAHQACSAALKCQAALTEFNQGIQKKGYPPFFTRIGIHTGKVIVGNLGTLERMNYTIMGDVVNAAARLQTVNKIYHTRIIISEAVYKVVNAQFLARPLDIVEVKGKREKIKIYELMAQYQGDPVIAPHAEQIELSASFSQAFDAYHQGDLQKAKMLFQKIHTQFPTDYPTQFYLLRIS